MRLLLVLALVVIGSQPSQGPDYFPDGILGAGKPESFKRDWYSKHLIALGEPSLLEASRREDSEIYRFLWLRTFHEPVSIRVVLNEAPVLELRVADGAGGYDPGELEIEITRKLRRGEVKRIRSAIDELEFWELPSREGRSGLDGASWILEGVKENEYHLVDRWSPDEGAVYELGRLLLRMSRHKVKSLY